MCTTCPDVEFLVWDFGQAGDKVIHTKPPDRDHFVGGAGNKVAIKGLSVEDFHTGLSHIPNQCLHHLEKWSLTPPHMHHF